MVQRVDIFLMRCFDVAQYTWVKLTFPHIYFAKFHVHIDSIDIEVAGESEDEDFNDEEMVTILSFFNDCSVQELTSVPRLSAKKAERIIQMRPFDSWNDLVSKYIYINNNNLSLLILSICITPIGLCTFFRGDKIYT